jgi:hypothetical protein
MEHPRLVFAGRGDGNPDGLRSRAGFGLIAAGCSSGAYHRPSDASQ